MSDPEVLVEEEQHGEKQEAMARTLPMTMLILKLQSPEKMHPGLQGFCGKNLDSCGIKPPSAYSPSLFHGWYEVCLSLRRASGS